MKINMARPLACCGAAGAAAHLAASAATYASLRSREIAAYGGRVIAKRAILQTLARSAHLVFAGISIV